MKKHYAVIGGGWAGCAAAIELTQASHRVTLFEAARTLGGRARAVDINGIKLDNGQHILLGAYTATLDLMQCLGMDEQQTMLRLPLQMRYPTNSGGMDLLTQRLPAPWHLLFGLMRSTGLSKTDKFALLRFLSKMRWMNWRLANDCSVAELVNRYKQTTRSIQLLWRPLCLAALNTPLAHASAQVFLNVLRDSLGARRSASDMLIPRVDLTNLLPQQAALWIERHGGKVQYGSAVQAISHSPTQSQTQKWRIKTNNNDDDNFDGIVIATPAKHAQALLSEAMNYDATPSWPAFQYEAITTCYLQYPPTCKLPQVFFALLDDVSNNAWGQFVFDRGQLDAQQAGLFAVVISAASTAITLEHTTLGTAIARQLSNTFAIPELAQPIWVKVISEKRATFACTPSLIRPGNATALKGVVIAGDYTASDYPATLEAAVQSGIKAARLII